MTHHNDTQGWEREFNELFGEGSPYVHALVVAGKTRDGAIKEFIAKELQRARDEELLVIMEEAMDGIGKRVARIITNGKPNDEKIEEIIKLFNIVGG